MNCEDHPLTLLVKKVYELSEWACKRPLIKVEQNDLYESFEYYSADEISQESEEEEDEISSESEEDYQIPHEFGENENELPNIRIYRNREGAHGKDLKNTKTEETKGSNQSKLEPDFENFIKLFHNNADAGFIPNIVNSIDQWIEFDQKFYTEKFDPKHITEEQKFDFSKSGLKVSEAAKITELYSELDSETSYYRLRLAAIAYDLSTLKQRYKFIFKQLIAGRFVTILALDIQGNEGSSQNVDIPGIIFSGYRIPSILQFSKTQLYLVDKQFYHNIIQDNELLRRILFNQVALVLDYEKELKYQRLLNQKHDISQSEDISLVKFYEDPDSQLLSILMKLKNTQKLLSVCHRSTGGHEDGQPKVGNIFEAVSGYKNQAYSAEQIYYPNGLY